MTVPNNTKKICRISFLGIVLALIACICLLSLVPPISRDALTHHLAVPKLYLLHGGIYEIPNLQFSYYPMNLDLLYMIPLAFGNDIIPKFIHFSFALLTAAFIYNYLKKRLDSCYAALGVLFFLSIPVILKLSITVYVDLGLIFFSTASLLLLFQWKENGYPYKTLIFAGMCCGLAVGTKYNGLVTLLLLTSSVPILYIRSQDDQANASRSSLAYGLVFAFCALLACAPWLLRNYLWTGNPLYPLFEHLFNQTNSTQLAPTGHAPGIFKLRELLYHETPLQILLLPIRIFFEGRDNIPQYFDGKLNPFLLLLPALSFIKTRQKPEILLEQTIMLTFCMFFVFFALFETTMRIRYIAPIVPFLVILSIIGLRNLHDILKKIHPKKLQRRGVIVTGSIIVIMLSYNINYLIDLFSYTHPLSYITGQVSRSAYITHYRPEYPVIQFANKQTNSGKTLCLFLGNRGYHMDFPHTFDTPASQTGYFTQLVKTTANKKVIASKFKQNGYDNILTYDNLTVHWLQSMPNDFRKRALYFFQHETKLIYSKNGYSLFHIVPE